MENLARLLKCEKQRHREEGITVKKLSQHKCSVKTAPPTPLKLRLLANTT